MARVLIVEGDAGVLHAVRRLLHNAGLEVDIARTGRQALALVAKRRPDVLVVRAEMADLPGLEVFDHIRRSDSRLPVIVTTAEAATVIEAMKRGAFESLLQPLDLPRLRAAVQRALAPGRGHDDVAIRGWNEAGAAIEPLVGRSPAMQAVYKAIGRVAPSDVTVLIRGESGTGKELVARALHHHSPRKDLPFLAINCAALPETLLESELFGHERGAFTGAERRRPGKFEQADRGTLFLDEIGDMSLATQAKVLRLVQDQRFERLGGNESLQTDVRLIAATNKDLEQDVAAGRFRNDLLYRLNAYTIWIPPLRQRREDIPLLVESFLPCFAQRLGRPIRGLTPETLSRLCAYAWPGNVRQLQSVLKYAIIQSTADLLTPDCLPASLDRGAVAAATDRTRADACTVGIADFTQELLRAGELDIYRRIEQEMDRVVLGAVLRHVAGNQVKASAILGISRTTLRAKLRALNSGVSPGP
jgi:two-component system nitrogen regulation response regulator GlnG